MAEVGWFPKAQSRSLGCVRIDAIRKSPSSRRYGDKICREGSVAGTVTKLSRHFWNDLEEWGKKSYIINTSFPLSFRFVGSSKIQIGNSVPPLMMRAIATRVGELFFGLEPMKITEKTNYLDILEEAWQQHLAPREPDVPTVVSTFAGCGGSSLGYSMAGYRELLAVEWDNKAVATFKLNFPDVPVYHGDIHKLTVEHCFELIGLSPGELDVLDGSPPCQGFSTAGKRQMNDIRNQLSFEFVRLLRGLRPKVFIMENVSGLVKGKMKLIFAEIMKALKASGYQVKCKLLNAKYFHVPQSRQRLIWIGVRDDLRITPSYPRGQRGKIVPRMAFEGLGDFCDRPLPSVLKKYAKRHPGGWNTHSGIYQQVKGNRAGSISLKWMEWGKTSGTIPKQEIALAGVVHPDKERYLNLMEVKRIGSFPDGFQFLDRKSGWRQIGNSVPPLFIWAIASYIQQEILTKANGPTRRTASRGCWGNE